MRTETLDFRSFCQGGLVAVNSKRKFKAINTLLPASFTLPILSNLYPQAVTTMATSNSIDHAFDPILSLLQHMALPVASIVLAWACLQAMIGKPAEAVDKAKWAILGYLAMNYAPGLLRSI